MPLPGGRAALPRGLAVRQHRPTIEKRRNT